MHKRLFPMNNSRQALSTKNYEEHETPESDKVCFVGGGWGSRVSRSLDLDFMYMMGRRLTTRFLRSWIWREGMVRACLGQTYNNTQKCRTWSRDDPRNTKQQLNASITLCMRLSVYWTDKQTFHATGWHSFIVLVTNKCAVYINLQLKKKLLINCKTSFLRIVVGKKVANQNWRDKWRLFIKMATDWQVSEVGDTRTPLAGPGRGRAVQIEWISAWTVHLGFPCVWVSPSCLRAK